MMIIEYQSLFSYQKQENLSKRGRGGGVETIEPIKTSHCLFLGVRSLVVRSFHCTYTTWFKSLENCNNRTANDPEHFIQQNTLQRIYIHSVQAFAHIGSKFLF